MAPHLLSVSDCEPLSVGELLALEPGARAALDDCTLGYTETAGPPDLRQALADQYADDVGPEDVVVHAAGEEAIFTLMHAVVQPSDHVIVHHPSYQSLFELPRILGAHVSLWRATRRTRWRLDLDELEELARADTRLIVVNVPHNPTGYMMTREEQARLIEVADWCGAYILCDELYRGLECDSAETLSPIADVYLRGVSLGAMSKVYGLAGLRIGWLAVRDRGVRKRVLQIKDYTTICSSAPSEFLATIALRHRNVLLRRSRRIVAANRPHLIEFFGRHAKLWDWVPPAGGVVTFPTLRTPDSIGAFCDDVLEKTGVLLLPGTVFEAGSREVRLGFGRASFIGALERLDAYLGSVGMANKDGRPDSSR